MQVMPMLTRALYQAETKEFTLVNNALGAVTLVSVGGIILETVPSLTPYASVFVAIEWITVAIFTLEYIGRIVANQTRPLAYIFSFFGLIDLISIIPTYLGLTNLTFLKTARVLRILRLLRIIRLAKVARLGAAAARDVEDYQHLYRLNIQIYFFALAAAIAVFGTLIFVFEDGREPFTSIPLGMLWAVKPLLGGIAQEIPSTVGGEIVAVAARFTGLILFGLLIAIIGGGVQKLLFGGAVETRPPRTR